MSLKIAVACALLALCLARPDTLPSYSYGAPSFSEESHESLEVSGPAKYEFSYAVKDHLSGNDFGHQETRDNDRTDGSYFVYLPDGRLQKVVYFVHGDSGFVPEVTYEGEAHFPEPESIEIDSSEETFVYAAPPPPPPPPVYGAPQSESIETDSSEETFVFAAPLPPLPVYGAPI